LNNRPNISPPKWADRFLEFYCKSVFLEEIQGDVHELFEARITKQNRSMAKVKFVWDVLRFFKWSNIKKSKRLNSNTMTRNNLKVAARVLWRQKANATLNISGIAVGLTCFILISLYVKQQVSYDGFHQKKDRIYRAWVKEVYDDGRVFFNTTTPLQLGYRLEENLPEVEEFVLFDQRETFVGRGDDRVLDQFNIVSANFFKVFDFEVLKGNRVNPLDELSSVVLSASYGQKYFGEIDPIGQLLPMQVGADIHDFIVTAIVEDAPLNSGFQYTMLVSLENRPLFYSDGMMKRWFDIGPETYVLLKEGTNSAGLNHKTEAMVKSLVDGSGAFGDAPVEEHYLIGFQPLTDIHLNADVPSGKYPVGNPQYVYILGAIGLLILVIACMNYTTLSIGQSLKRAKEVGVRKVAGAHPNNLIIQYLTESMLIAFLATMLGVLLTIVALPVFNQLAQVNLAFEISTDNVIYIILVALIIGFLSGIYPALILSRFNVASILRSGTVQSGGRWVRKAAITFQFLLTVFLISSTLIMRKQLKYLQSSDLGYSYDAMISVPLYADSHSGKVSEEIATAFKNADMLKNELSKNTVFSDFGSGSHVFGSEGWVRLGFDSNTGNYMQFQFLIVDPYYLDAFDIDLVDGVKFDPALDIHKSQGVILNETAVAYFGLENPIGKKLPGDKFGDHQIIGVVKDFNFESLREEISPLVIVQNVLPIFQGINDFNAGDSFIPKLVFKYQGSNLSELSDLIDKSWSGLFPNEKLNFYFVEQSLQNQYEDEARVNQIVSIATLLSIVIACFGLLGLTILMVNSKIKEIGIRKVLGASSRSILQILLGQFSIQLIIAICLSIPITWYLMSIWLDDFAFRTNIGVDPFIFSAVITQSIVLAVIGFHAFKAARSNPIKSLRIE
jgi:putative ABC transport system permease protein